MGSLPRYSSAFEMGEPSTPEAASGVQELLDQEHARGLPDHLQPSDVGALMEVLHKWEAADPQNGLPLAFEAKYLVVSGQPDAGLARLEAAAAAPKVDAYDLERMRAVAAVLNRMGMPAPEAALRAF